MAVPLRGPSPNGVKMSSPRRSLSGTIVNGTPSGCDKCAVLREVSTFSISSGLSIYRYLYVGNVERILFQGLLSSIGISMNLMPLNLLRFVRCLMERCIFYWCSMMSKLYNY